MAEIRAFKGTYYRSSKPYGLASFVSPCVSEVNKEMRYKLAQRSPQNIIRVIKPLKDFEGIPDYATSATIFDDMLSKGCLVTDDAPCLYGYKLGYRDRHGVMKERTGFYCLLKATDYRIGGVMPHERTFEDAVRKWGDLTKSVGSDISAVFCLSNSPDLEETLGSCSTSNDIVQDFSDFDGQHHSLFRIRGAQADKLALLIGESTVVIADGHHRYESASLIKGLNGGYVLACIFPLGSDGIEIMPFHRHIKGIDPALLDDFPDRVSCEYIISSFPEFSSMQLWLSSQPHGSPSLGIYAPGFGYSGLASKDYDSRCSAELLHNEVLSRFLEFGKLPYMKDGKGDRIVRARVNYTPNTEECHRAIDLRLSQIAFFTVAPSPSQVFKAALSGRTFPEKSTCFKPKPIEGLLLRRFQES